MMKRCLSVLVMFLFVAASNAFAYRPFATEDAKGSRGKTWRKSR